MEFTPLCCIHLPFPYGKTQMQYGEFYFFRILLGRYVPPLMHTFPKMYATRPPSVFWVTLGDANAQSPRSRGCKVMQTPDLQGVGQDEALRRPELQVTEAGVKGEVQATLSAGTRPGRAEEAGGHQQRLQGSKVFPGPTKAPLPM